MLNKINKKGFVIIGSLLAVAMIGILTFAFIFFERVGAAEGPVQSPVPKCGIADGTNFNNVVIEANACSPGGSTKGYCVGDGD